MGETPRQLVQEINRTRDHVGQDLLTLRRRARREFRGVLQLCRHPLWLAGAALAGAAAVGFFLGRAFRSLK